MRRVWMSSRMEATATDPTVYQEDGMTVGMPNVAAIVAIELFWTGALVAAGACVGGTGVAVGAGALLHAARTSRPKIAATRTGRIVTS